VTIVAAGSIATDHLMVFPGRFADQLVEGGLERISLSFLADDLEVRRGGIGANIAFGLGALGLRPVLVGAAGVDFAEYRDWLAEHGVETRHVRISPVRHTARFVCTTDADQNQIATFYAGAMSDARDIDLAVVLADVPDVEIVVISPDDPAAMLRHTAHCRRAGVRFAADPSQQLARMDGGDIRALVEGATYLFTNGYEADLLLRKTGWSTDDVLAVVEFWVTTHGDKGSTIAAGGREPLHVDAVPAEAIADPTGVGDAYRVGFLAARGHGADLEHAARLGSALATLVVETVGTQQYRVDPQAVVARVRRTYGDAAADAIAPVLAGAAGM
jgi:adenosine kinase